jgi:hypothetical protein
MSRKIVWAVAAALLAAPGTAGAQALDYDVFKNKVEPIFITKRPGYTRCVVCHGGANNGLHLERLRAGAAAFTEEQSKKNFATVSALVTPGKPDESHLLLYPLVPQEGGSAYHSGGRQWPSKNDPNWQTIARWIKGEK